jgi:hypothetical protein
MSGVKPHRLSLSDILTMTLQRGSGNQDSVSLTRNAKGETQIEVVARSRENETLRMVEQRARETYERLRATFPLSTGYVGANGGE